MKTPVPFVTPDSTKCVICNAAQDVRSKLRARNKSESYLNTLFSFLENYLFFVPKTEEKIK